MFIIIVKNYLAYQIKWCISIRVYQNIGSYDWHKFSMKRIHHDVGKKYLQNILSRDIEEDVGVAD